MTFAQLRIGQSFRFKRDRRTYWYKLSGCQYGRVLVDGTRDVRTLDAVSVRVLEVV